MKKYGIGASFAIAFCSIGFGQQMFTNGDFENYTSCPTGWDETNKIVGCIGNNDTPDYYNCNYNPNTANSGTGSIYLGTIRDNSNGQDITEGVTLELDNALTIGQQYEISIENNYGITVWGDPNFDYSQIHHCYNLKFLFSMGNETGDPASPHYEIDAEAAVGNSNTSYTTFTFNYTPNQSYTHVYIVSGSTSTNTASNPDSDCMSAGSLAYIYYNIIDDLSILPTTSNVSLEESENELFQVYPNPANTVFTVDFGNNMPVRESIQLLDLTGKVIYTSHIESSQIEINVSQFIPGVYLLKTETGTSVSRLIIQ